MSDKPVAERLQVKKDRRLAVVNAPPAVDRAIGIAKARTDVVEADVVLLFAANRKALDTGLPKLLKKIKAGAIIWLAYPKLTSKLAADLSRDVIHKLAPDYGLDTVSQIAIDSDWSALRLKRVG